MGALGGGGNSRNRADRSGDNFDVNKGTASGENGGKAAGISVTGPGGTTKGGTVGVGADGGVARAHGTEGPHGAGSASGKVTGPDGGMAAGSATRGPAGGTSARGTAVGPDGGAAAGRFTRGPAGGESARGAAVGPNGRVAAGGAVRGPGGGAAARGVVAGPGGAAAGFARVTPSGRYTSAVGVRNNYNHWDIYGRGWYNNHPGAWFAAVWTANTIWRTATWSSMGAWMPYAWAAPVYYDYGNNVVYNEGDVYVNGDNVGTTQEYYEQASEIAQAGAEAPEADAPADASEADASEAGEWMPLGVFALTKVDDKNTDSAKSDVTIQLAVNKDGIIRGNYTDTKTGTTEIVQGSVDKKTQRVAFSVGDKKSNLIETGLYNLTKDEAPALVHVGADKTEQWLLVRLQNKDAGANDESNANAS